MKPVSERAARHWFQMYRFGVMYLCDEPRIERPQILEDGALKTAMQKDKCQTCFDIPNASRFLMKDSDFTCAV